MKKLILASLLMLITGCEGFLAMDSEPLYRIVNNSQDTIACVNGVSTPNIDVLKLVVRILPPGKSLIENPRGAVSFPCPFYFISPDVIMTHTITEIISDSLFLECKVLKAEKPSSSRTITYEGN